MEIQAEMSDINRNSQLEEADPKKESSSQIGIGANQEEAMKNRFLRNKAKIEELYGKIDTTKKKIGDIEKKIDKNIKVMGLPNVKKGIDRHKLSQVSDKQNFKAIVKNIDSNRHRLKSVQNELTLLHSKANSPMVIINKERALELNAKMKQKKMKESQLKSEVDILKFEINRMKSNFPEEVDKAYKQSYDQTNKNLKAVLAEQKATKQRIHALDKEDIKLSEVYVFICEMIELTDIRIEELRKAELEGKTQKQTKEQIIHEAECIIADINSVLQEKNKVEIQINQETKRLQNQIKRLDEENVKIIMEARALEAERYRMEAQKIKKQKSFEGNLSKTALQMKKDVSKQANSTAKDESSKSPYLQNIGDKIQQSKKIEKKPSIQTDTNKQKQPAGGKILVKEPTRSKQQSAFKGREHIQSLQTDRSLVKQSPKVQKQVKIIDRKTEGILKESFASKYDPAKSILNRSRATHRSMDETTQGEPDIDLTLYKPEELEERSKKYEFGQIPNPNEGISKKLNVVLSDQYLAQYKMLISKLRIYWHKEDKVIYAVQGEYSTQRSTFTLKGHYMGSKIKDKYLGEYIFDIGMNDYMQHIEIGHNQSGRVVYLEIRTNGGNSCRVGEKANGTYFSKKLKRYHNIYLKGHILPLREKEIPNIYFLGGIGIHINYMSLKK